MAQTRRNFLALIGSTAIAPVVSTALFVQISGETQRPSDQTLSDAYLYLLSRMLIIRQERMDTKAKGFAYNPEAFSSRGNAAAP